MDVDVGGDVFDAMSKALDSDVFETMQLEDEADASSKIAPAAAGDRGLDSAGQSALPLKDDAGVANDPLLEWRAGRARSDERHRNERKTEQLGQAIAGPKAALGLHGKEIADLERKSLETPRRKEAADGAGATGAPSLGAGAAPVAPAALATLATPATPAALRGLGSGPKLPGARVNRLSSRNQGFIRSYTPCDSTSAGASAFLASASRRKRACDVLEGKASEEVEDPTATMGSYRSMRPRRGATTRARSVQAKESLDRLVVRLQGSRGRACSPIFLPDTQLCRKPREEEIRDYDVGFALLATNGTLEQLEAALQSGKSPNACTRFGESLLHSLARRGDTHVDKLRLLLKHGASAFVSDDFGRTPLHNAFWCDEPAIETVTALLQAQNGEGWQLLMSIDCRGALPATYATEPHQDIWRKYFTSRASTIWPRRTKKSSKSSAAERRK